MYGSRWRQVVAAAGLMATGLAFAEAPMSVDDAGTMDAVNTDHN